MRGFDGGLTVGLSRPTRRQPNPEAPYPVHIHRELIMEDARFFDGQADRCWQLAWQCFHLKKAQKLNAMGNELAATARKLRILSAEGTSETAGTLAARRATSEKLAALLSG